MREVLDATSHWNDLSSMIQEKHEPIKEMTIQEEGLEELSNVGLPSKTRSPRQRKI
jgi:hypothetical protein